MPDAAPAQLHQHVTHVTECDAKCMQVLACTPDEVHASITAVPSASLSTILCATVWPTLNQATGANAPVHV